MKNLVKFLQVLTTFAKLKVFVVPPSMASIALTIFKSGEGSDVEKLLIDEEMRKNDILYELVPGEFAYVINQDFTLGLNDETQAVNCLLQCFLAIDDKCLAFENMNDSEQSLHSMTSVARAAELVGFDNAVKAIIDVIKLETPLMFNDEFTEAMLSDQIKNQIMYEEPTPEQQQFNIGILSAVYRGRVAACNQQ